MVTVDVDCMAACEEYVAVYSAVLGVIRIFVYLGTKILQLV